MKGLLLKDIYQMRKYCRSILFILIVFLAVSLLNSDFSFLRAFICLLVGMIPMTLLSYDERSKWDRYCITLPVSRKASVTEKYLLGLILVLIVGTVCTLTSLIVRYYTGGELSGIIPEIGFQYSAALLLPSISLPFCFKFGTEKGRIFYLVFVGVMSAGTVFLTQYLLFEGPLPDLPALFLCLPLGALVLYFLSWLISCKLYETREL